MIRNLYRFTDLKFPVVLMKKYLSIKEDSTFLYLDNITLIKQATLFDTFDISNFNLPETRVYYELPSILLANSDQIKDALLIDDNLNVFIPVKKVQVTIKRHIFKNYDEETNSLIVSEIPYFLDCVTERNATYPIIAQVEGLFFHIGWSNKEKKAYEVYI